MKKLTDKQLSKIMIDDAQLAFAAECVKSKKHEVMILEQRKQIIAYETDKLRSELENMRKAEADCREKSAANKKMIAKAHKLSGNWGYNPDSGEIVID